jgi:hypothetical protein
VDDLHLPVAGEGLGVGGQTGSVPAVVTGELASQVAGLVGEGACETASEDKSADRPTVIKPVRQDPGRQPHKGCWKQMKLQMLYV